MTDKKTLDQTVINYAERLSNYDQQSLRHLRKLHWKNTNNWESLLPENAKITAKLALSDFTQNKIKLLLNG